MPRRCGSTETTTRAAGVPFSGTPARRDVEGRGKEGASARCARGANGGAANRRRTLGSREIAAKRSNGAARGGSRWSDAARSRTGGPTGVGRPMKRSGGSPRKAQRSGRRARGRPPFHQEAGFCATQLPPCEAACAAGERAR
ncbi:hypothetical protein DP42_5613 [Burkholderia pseudomallei]|nr:hypothetical protein DP42_5613 [Burkholderia pseudomallei]